MTASRFLPLALAVLAASGCSGPAAAPAPSRTPTLASASAKDRFGATEARIFGLINAERRQHGLPALVYNEQLDQMAVIQARNMAHFQRMSHVLPESSLPTLGDRAHYVAYPFGRLAENVALGYPNAETVVEGWMTSTGHRANILNPDVVETGIAVARSSAGGLYYCQVFGRRINSL